MRSRPSNWQIPARHYPTIILGFILLVGFALRIHHLGVDSLSLDEIGHVRVARSGLGPLLSGVRRHHGAAPLDYLLLHLWSAVGSGDFWVRYPAAIYGTLAVAATYALGRRLCGTLQGLIAAALLAASPLHVEYSQEARFYSLAVLLTALLMLAFVAAARDPASRPIWYVYFALAFLGLYTYYFIAIVIELQAIALLFSWLGRRGSFNNYRVWRRALFGYLVVAVLFVPWLAYDLFWPSSHPLGPPVLSQALLAEIGPAWVGFASPNWTVWLLVALFAFGAVRMFRRSDTPVLTASNLMIAVLPVFTVLALDTVISYFFAPRQALFVLPAVLVPVADGIVGTANLGARAASGSGRDRSQMAALVATVVALTVTLGAAPGLRKYFETSKEDWRAVAMFLSANVSGGERVAAPLTSYAQHYFPGLSEFVVEVVPGSDYDRIGELVGRSDGLWLITSPSYPGSNPGPGIKEWATSRNGGALEYAISTIHVVYSGSGVCDNLTESRAVDLTEGVDDITLHCPWE